MGSMDSKKGANFNFGTVDSPDFMSCYITTKGDHFMITGSQAGTYEFAKSDVASIKVVASGGNWIKYKMTFKDDKIAVIHSVIPSVDIKNGLAKPQSGMTVAPIERFFGDIL